MVQTTTITVNIGNDVIDELRRLASKEKQKKGFLGRTITQATRIYLKEKEQEEIAQRQMKKMEKGYNMGKILIKNRDELYDRF